MTLQELTRLSGIGLGPAPGGVEVTGVTADSRRIEPGMVFFALPGEHADGHAYVRQAARDGAVAVAGGRQDTTELEGLPYLTAPSPRQTLGEWAHALAGDPTQHMTVIGVTGTNGKSSTVRLIRHILSHAGRKTACFGTLGYEFEGETIIAPHTTPFAEDLAPLFARARRAGVRHVAMEVSSHALDQRRTAGIRFGVGVFTNLTQDHLDYHGDAARYRAAKLRLFDAVNRSGAFTVVNLDDPTASAFIEASRVPCISFGEAGDCRAANVSFDAHRSRFRTITPWGEADATCGLLGRHNVANALAALAVAGGLGIPLGTIVEALATMPAVPGRFEQVAEGQPFSVIVDYAHTEDGLRNVLRAARTITTGRVICVFGCGGDRDRTKRPRMAQASAELADYSVLTSDNPRTEDPLAILEEVESGMIQARKEKDADYSVEPDRCTAIEKGLAAARPGDLVLIAGKGHEDYQIIGTQRIHFDDRETARTLLRKRTA